MKITKTIYIPKGKLIQVMADTEILESHPLKDNEAAIVTITIEPGPEKTPDETV